MNLRSLAAFALTLPACLALIDCSSAEEPHDEPEICQEISSVCHPAGEVDAESEICHEQAHEGDAQLCEDIYSDCMATCEAVLGMGGGGGAGGAAGH